MEKTVTFLFTVKVSNHARVFERLQDYFRAEAEDTAYHLGDDNPDCEVINTTVQIS